MPETEPERPDGLPFTRLCSATIATDRFVDLVHEHGSTRLKVRPLWSSETGAIGFIKDPMVEFERYPPGFGSDKRAAMQASLDRRGD